VIKLVMWKIANLMTGIVMYVMEIAIQPNLLMMFAIRSVILNNVTMMIRNVIVLLTVMIIC